MGGSKPSPNKLQGHKEQKDWKETKTKSNKKTIPWCALLGCLSLLLIGQYTLNGGNSALTDKYDDKLNNLSAQLFDLRERTERLADIHEEMKEKINNVEAEIKRLKRLKEVEKSMKTKFKSHLDDMKQDIFDLREDMMEAQENLKEELFHVHDKLVDFHGRL
mmetsp:Transcript_18176/g.27282  ORF Transcript_18176/g.27282 Transcript_18176/m.27282 type:complete len:162 (+) Transcript_18176:44-529(+)